MPVRKYWDLAQMKAKVKRDLDIESEVFVRPSELVEYFNDAINDAESEIHASYEDYFLSEKTYTLVEGQEDYILPDDIYAHKIRRVMYNNGSSVYTINSLGDWKKFEAQNIAQNFSTSDLYQFMIMNLVAGAPVMRLVPKARETGGFVKMYYYRQANRLENDADICDIPEGYGFIFQYVKTKIYEKEGHPNIMKAVQDLEAERQRLNGVLATMVPDANNEIEMDVSFYEEMN